MLLSDHFIFLIVFCSQMRLIVDPIQIQNGHMGIDLY
jgi:hypothetical protein